MQILFQPGDTSFYEHPAQYYNKKIFTIISSNLTIDLNSHFLFKTRNLQPQ